jgi:ribosomal protein L11 methyltransferase
MAWLQLETKLGQSEPGRLETALEELGAVSISLRDAGDEPLLEPAPGETPLWSSSIVTALFPEGTQAAGISAALTSLIEAKYLRYTKITDNDWQKNWQQSLKAQQFGKCLWVVPHKHSATPAGSVVVRLQPGLAFGTGEHPTTAMCLEWLESTIGPEDTVLDYGCGSGLLGIAAAALGASAVWATDIDDQALAATRNNAKNNACGDRLRAVEAKVLDNPNQFDVLVANILSGTLIELGPNIEPLMQAGARMAITGILAEQAEDVANAWSSWADMRVSMHRDNWVLLTGTKHANI